MHIEQDMSIFDKMGITFTLSIVILCAFIIVQAKIIDIYISVATHMQFKYYILKIMMYSRI